MQSPEPAAAEPSPKPSPLTGRSWWSCALIILGGWALLAYPALLALLTAYVGFTGCFIECSRPDPAVGFMGSAVLAALVVTPVLAGLAHLRRSRGLWIACGCCAVFVIGIVVWGELSGST